MSNRTELIISDEFKEQVRLFNEDFFSKYDEIGKEKTPQLDGAGRKIIEKRPDGKDYIIDSYMRTKLDEHFPGWSWEAAAPLHFLGSEWVVAQGHLIIIDYHLVSLGISPPVRKYYGVDAVRIQYKKDSQHVPENIVDVGDNCQSANTGALKRAINRLTRIGDDVYGKRVDIEGAGTYETILETQGGVNEFLALLHEKKIIISEACKILEVNSLVDVTDYAEAWNRIKEAKSIKGGDAYKQ